MLSADSLEVPLATETIRSAGSSIGTGGVIVYEQGRDAVEIVGQLLDFYVDESCGRCLPCRIGVSKMHEITSRLLAGEGSPEDLSRLREISKACTSTTLCGYGQTVSVPALSAMELFPHDFESCVAVRGDERE